MAEQAKPDQPDQTPADHPVSTAARARKGSKDAWIKLGFIIVLIIGGVLIYIHQLKGPTLDWQEAENAEDVNFVLDQARRDSRPVVIFFQKQAPSQFAKDMVKDSLNHSQVKGKIKELGALTLQVRVSGQPQQQLLEQYDIEELPAVVLFNKSGQISARKSGFVGHADLTNLLVEAGR
ncbi:MAG: TlpA family protein disulfide reductase [Phycisphaerae bacterium]